MAVDFNALGNRIKSIRKEKRVSQAYLAKKMQVSVAYLSRIERGSSHVNLKRIAELSDLLDVSLGYLLTGIVEESEDYLTEEFKEILKKCNPEKQRAILDMAKLISTM